MLQEKMSEHLKVPYVYLPDRKQFLCSNGVMFTLEEYKNGIDLQDEYEKRKSNDTLYDYKYAKSTGLLRKQRNNPDSKVAEKAEEPAVERKAVPTEQVGSNGSVPKAHEADGGKEQRSISILSFALLLTSIGCMYISTVHTATYLFDYVDKFSAWVMSTVITIYCSCAFEVVVLFKERRRYILSSLFCLLWVLVITFSMATTVSVFYDRYNFTVVENASASSGTDSGRLQLDMLRTNEKDIRDAIEEKKADLEYRRSREYATTAVRTELNRLQEKLDENIKEQMAIVEKTPDAVKDEKDVQKKETMFAFLGRVMGINGGILEFIMSTLTAVFINLISPMTVTMVVSLLGGMKDIRKEEENAENNRDTESVNQNL